MENMLLPVGSMIHGKRYRVEKLLGSGGFGNTYLVRKLTDNKTFAMKEFFMRIINSRENGVVTVSVKDNKPTFESQKLKFKNEAIRLASLQHPNIVQVSDFFEENGTAYYVMDYIEGVSLREYMQRLKRPLTVEEARPIIDQMLDALRYLHSRSPRILHLDIKPANIMLSEGKLTLIDFGASKQVVADNEIQHTLSTMAYSLNYAPTEQMEQISAMIGPWTDFYSLGATLYNILTYEKPPGNTFVSSLGERAFHFPKDMDERIRHLVIWMMSPGITHRPQSVDEIVGYLSSDSDITAVGNAKDDGFDDNEITVSVSSLGKTRKKGKETPPVSPQKTSWKKYLYGILGVVAAICLLVVIVNSFKSSSFWQDASEEVVGSDRYDIVSRLSKDLESKSSSLFNETLRFFDAWINEELTDNQRMVIMEVTEARDFMIEHEADISSALGHSTEAMDRLKSYTDHTVKEIIDERAKRVGVEVPADLYENDLYKSEQRIW